MNKEKWKCPRCANIDRPMFIGELCRDCYGDDIEKEVKEKWHCPFCGLGAEFKAEDSPCMDCATAYAPREASIFLRLNKDTIVELASEDITQEDIDSCKAQKCECCKKYDLLEVMKSHPAGYYCEDCFDAVFN